MNLVYFGLFCLTVIQTVCADGEWCRTSTTGHPVYCRYGCCDNKCCSFTTMAIVGAVFGGLVFLGTLIACIFCIYCMCKENHNRRSTNVLPVNTNSIYVHNSAYGHPPPSYNRYSAFPASSAAQPPPYSSDPVYPPGTVTSSATNNTDHPPPAYSSLG